MLSFSPLDIIEKDKSCSRIYLFLISNYEDKFTAIRNEYELAINDIKNILAATKEQTEISELFERAKNTTILTIEKIVKNLQIEDGEYKFTITIQYEEKFKHFTSTRTRETKKSIKFTVESNVREILKMQIEKYMHKATLSTLTNDPQILPWPTYTPIKCKEIHD